MSFNRIKDFLITFHSKSFLSLNIFGKSLTIISLNTISKILDHLNELLFEDSIKKC